MGFNKKFFTTGGIVASSPAEAVFDPLQNFETVTYTGNGSTQKITGYIRKGAAFNGSSSYIDTGINNDVGTRSISLWFHYTSAPSSNEVLIGAVSTGSAGYTIRLETSVLKFQHQGETTASTALSNLNVGWNHVVGVIDGSTSELYLNGSSVGTGGVADAGSHSLYIGAENDVGSVGSHYDGKIDQVRIFNKALDQDDVDDLYLETYADPKKSTTDYFGDGSGVALYELDEDANDSGRYGSGAIDTGQSAVFNNNSLRSVVNVSIPLGSVKTISHWIKFNEFQADNIHIFSSSSNNLQLVLLNGSRNFAFYDGVSTKQFGSAFPNDFNWHHLVWVLNGTSTSLYLDGSFVSTITTASTTQTDIVIGSNSALSGVRGSIDQVRIYDTALLASDVEALVSETNVPTSNLVAHYKLDGNANDETTNYNGTASNVTYTDPAEFPVYNGTPTNVNFLGMAFQPDLVWIKNRNNTQSNRFYDSIRGANLQLSSNQTATESNSGGLTSFDTNGFSLDNWASVNTNNYDYVAWCWKAGGTAVSNTDGGNNSAMVSANPDAGFSIITYTGNNTNNSSVGHGLNQAPEMFIYKRRSSASSWIIAHKDVNNYQAYLEFNTGTSTNDSAMQSPTDSVIRFNTSSPTFNGSGQQWLIYAFHSVDGYQKVGSYTGTGSAGNTVTGLGFQPRFLLLKNATRTYEWVIVDSVRGGSNELNPNSSVAENGTGDPADITFDSDGFTLNNAEGATNNNNATIIYLAIA